MPARRSIHAALALSMFAGLAQAAPPNLDFGIVDDASYQAFRNAVVASEFVRTDYVLQENARVVGATTALVEYATRNPLATESQLAAFVAAFDTALSTFALGDPDLARSSNMLAAFRFAQIDDLMGEFVGTDTNIGEAVLELLGLDIPDPDGFESMRRRMVRYDQARIASLGNAPEWSSVLVVGFSGKDLAGAENPYLAGVLTSYLEGQGFEPVPDGIDDGRFTDMQLALDNALPADFAGFDTLRSQPFESSTAWGAITGGFDAIAISTTARLNDLSNELTMEPDLIEGIETADDMNAVESIVDEYRARIGEVSDERALINANALILLQSADPGIRELAEQSRSFAGAQLETNHTITAIAGGVQYVGGIATFGVGIAKADPAAAIGGLTDAVLAGLDLVDTFGGVSPPPAEVQIFDEIIEMRQQIEDVRVEMNMRFDRIETQLDVIYDAVATGFNALGGQIEDLQADVDDLSREMAVARSQLERIEDALWGVAESLFLADLTNLTNSVLDYRDDVGFDLPYAQGSPSFETGATELFSWATSFADDPVFAGPLVSDLTVANAPAKLDGDSIGRNVNDLRVFPTQLTDEMGQPLGALQPGRIVAPGPWAQAASAYVQLAEESPWYFAYMPGAMDDIDEIIDAGEDLTAAVAAGRDQDLFDALFRGYQGALDDVSDYIFINTRNNDVLGPAGLPQDDGQVSINPWLGLDQDLNRFAGVFTVLDGIGGLNDFPLPASQPELNWNYFGDNTLPEMLSVILGAEANGLNERFEVSVDAGEFAIPNDIGIRFIYIAEETMAPFRAFRIVREMDWRLTSFGSPVQISSDGAAQDRFDQDSSFWLFMSPQFRTGTDLTGTAFNTTNSSGDFFTIEIVSDTVSNPIGDVASYLLGRLDELQDEIWQEAIDDPAVEVLMSPADGFESLLEAYSTFSLPDMMEESTIARAALRGSPITGELSLSKPIDAVLAELLGLGDDGVFDPGTGDFDPAAVLRERAGYLQDEIDTAIAGGIPAGHSYVDWVLGELRDLKANASKLAVDDAYAASGTLAVAANEGLLVNDVSQDLTTSMVDTAFDPGLDPAQGTVQINIDGSFSFAPAPGFEGDASFGYRSMATIETDLGTVNVFSDPATVVVRVSGSVGCSAADLAEPYGTLDFDDVLAFLVAFGSMDPVADLAPTFGTFDFDDILVFLTGFGAGCP